MFCMNTHKRSAQVIGAFISLLATLLAGEYAQAAPFDARAVNCAANDGGAGPSGTVYTGYSEATFQRAINPSAGVLAIPANPVANQVLMSMDSFLPFYTGGAQGAAAPYYDCPMGALERFASNGVLVPGFSNVYATTVPGIGYRIAYYVNMTNPGDAKYAPVEFENEYQRGVLIFPFSGSQFGTAKASIELVATGGVIGPGVIDASQISAQSVLSGGGTVAARQLYRVYLTTNVIVTEPTCVAPAQAALTMLLPDLSTNALVQNGEGPMTDTTITVECTVPSQNSPSMTITSSYLVPGTTNTLANVSPEVDKAEGVGVELWIGPATTGGSYTAPTFGLAYPNQGSPVGALPTDAWNFVLGAKLKQLGAANEVKAGPVRSQATLTFTYN